MDNWRTAFAAHGLHIGQLLLTKEDFLDEHRSLNIRNTLFTLVDEGAIPIINENDSVCCDEIRIGDNDNLSALSAILWSADALILLSDVDGVYDKNPRDADAKFIERVDDIALLRGVVFIGSPGELGTGGIETKIEAAEKVCAYGIPLILADGRREDCIDILTSDSPSVARLGTLFSAK